MLILERLICRSTRSLAVTIGFALAGVTAAAKAWKARVLPASFLVDADGRIRHSHVGEIDWSQENARRAVAALLPR
ncbi:MAG: hypothetical protein EPO29_03525 [Betaproteobacteria bacterium]|nr:MAG: hypothetical protein EPO29_03525 [Betaproteobacteria bacterium]